MRAAVCFDPGDPPMMSQARPPAGAGAYRWDRRRMADDPSIFHRLMASAHLNGDDAVPIRPTRTRKRKPNFITHVKRAMKAGLDVRSASITADGVVGIAFAAPSDTPTASEADPPASEWDDVLIR